MRVPVCVYVYVCVCVCSSMCVSACVCVCVHDINQDRRGIALFKFRVRALRRGARVCE